MYMTPMLVHALNADLQEVKELQGSVATILNEDISAPDTEMPSFNVKWTAQMRERVGDLVEDMVRWGWM